MCRMEEKRKPISVAEFSQLKRFPAVILRPQLSNTFTSYNGGI